MKGRKGRKEGRKVESALRGERRERNGKGEEIRKKMKKIKERVIRYKIKKEEQRD